MESSNLVRRLRQGDDQAWSAIVDRHGPDVAGQLCKAGIPASELDAAVNTVFASAFTSFHRFDGTEGQLGAWLAGIARNIARQYFDALRDSPTTTDFAQDALADDRPTRDPDVVNADLSAPERALLEILASLREREREIILTWATCGGNGAEWTTELSERIGLSADYLRVVCRRIRLSIGRQLRERGFRVVAADGVDDPESRKKAK